MLYLLSEQTNDALFLSTQRNSHAKSNIPHLEFWVKACTAKRSIIFLLESKRWALTSREVGMLFIYFTFPQASLQKKRPLTFWGPQTCKSASNFSFLWVFVAVPAFYWPTLMEWTWVRVFDLRCPDQCTSLKKSYVWQRARSTLHSPARVQDFSIFTPWPGLPILQVPTWHVSWSN